MDYLKRKEGISLVVLCNTEPVYIHNRWLKERDIITAQEYEDAKGKPKLLNDGLSTFTIGTDISVYCDKNRFQIECSDITAAKRIIDICRETIKLNMPKAFAAVGVNADMDFTFNNQDDAVRFGDTFVPLEKWGKYVPEARVGAFTIQENNTHPTLAHPRKAINIQSVGMDDKTKQPLVRISVNNHYPIKDFDEMAKVLEKAQGKYEEFIAIYESIFNEQLA
ncbi:MAG: hypothetical protein J5965_16515 [Aeriscardovia sp.]|nr:hypothetical protein [Aeriscardovia sp.]MBO6254248.1 hypothetical protein [Bacteroidaceae bacterium]